MTRPLRFILECTKTGRAWTYATEAMARRAFHRIACAWMQCDEAAG